MNAAEPAIIAIGPTEYLRLSDFERFDDGSGWCAWLAVSVNAFECRRRKFYFSDLARFADDLNRAFRALSGSVTLGHQHEPDKIHFSFEPRGQAAVSGSLGQGDGTECVLRFRLAFDQTYVGLFLSQLRRIADAFDG